METFMYDANELASKYPINKVSEYLYSVSMPSSDLLEYEYFNGTDAFYIFVEQLGLVKVVFDDVH